MFSRLQALKPQHEPSGGSTELMTPAKHPSQKHHVGVHFWLERRLGMQGTQQEHCRVVMSQ